MKLGPQHYPIHQWKLAGKEKKGEKKKETLGNKSKRSIRNFVSVFLALSPPRWSTVTWWPSKGVQAPGALTTTAHSDICSQPHCSGTDGQDAAPLCSHAREQTKSSEAHLPSPLHRWKLALSWEQGQTAQSRTTIFQKRMGKRRAKD